MGTGDRFVHHIITRGLLNLLVFFPLILYKNYFLKPLQSLSLMTKLVKIKRIMRMIPFWNAKFFIFKQSLEISAAAEEQSKITFSFTPVRKVKQSTHYELGVLKQTNKSLHMTKHFSAIQ